MRKQWVWPGTICISSSVCCGCTALVDRNSLILAPEAMQHPRADWECNNQPHQLGSFCFPKWPVCQGKVRCFLGFFFKINSWILLNCSWIYSFSDLPAFQFSCWLHKFLFFRIFSTCLYKHFLPWEVGSVFIYWIIIMDYWAHFSPNEMLFNDFFFLLVK